MVSITVSTMKYHQGSKYRMRMHHSALPTLTHWLWDSQNLHFSHALKVTVHFFSVSVLTVVWRDLFLAVRCSFVRNQGSNGVLLFLRGVWRVNPGYCWWNEGYWPPITVVGRLLVSVDDVFFHLFRLGGSCWGCIGSCIHVAPAVVVINVGF